tara:strand:+ start:144 stop:2018 length:1875 start_codon:yes stop_codon:yes gene_type:complete
MIGIVVLLIVLFFILKKPSVKPAIQPDIMWGESFYRVIPQEESTVENYQVEYAGGSYTNVELSKMVEVTIKWKNKYGFDNVSEVQLTRKVGDALKDTKIFKKTDADSPTSIFTNFNTEFNEHVFKSDGGDVIGTNTFDMAYKIGEGAFIPIVSTLGENVVDLERKKIVLKIENKDATPVTFSPNIKERALPVVSFLNKGYNVHPGWDGKVPAEATSLLSQYLGENDKIKIFKKDESENDENIILEIGGGYLAASESSSILSISDTRDGALSLRLIKGQGETDTVYILGTLLADGKSLDKVVIIRKVGANFDVHLVKYADILNETEYNSMKMFFTEKVSTVTGKPCKYARTAIGGCRSTAGTETIAGKNVNVPRGKQVETIQMETASIGGGACKIDGKSLEDGGDSIIKNGDNYIYLKDCDLPCEHQVTNFDDLCTGRFGSCLKPGESGKLLQTDWAVSQQATGQGTCTTPAALSCKTSDSIAVDNITYSGTKGDCGVCGYTSASACDIEPTAEPQFRSKTTWTAKTVTSDCVANSGPPPATEYTTVTSAVCPATCYKPSWKKNLGQCSGGNQTFTYVETPPTNLMQMVYKSLANGRQCTSSLKPSNGTQPCSTPAAQVTRPGSQ